MDTSHPDKDINRDEGRLLGEMGIKQALLRVNNLCIVYVHLFLYLFLNIVFTFVFEKIFSISGEVVGAP